MALGQISYRYCPFIRADGPVKDVQFLNVSLNILLFAVPEIFPNRFSGIDVNLLQPSKVLVNIELAGAPDIPANKPAGIAPVKPLQPSKVL